MSGLLRLWEGMVLMRGGGEICLGECDMRLGKEKLRELGRMCWIWGKCGGIGLVMW